MTTNGLLQEKRKLYNGAKVFIISHLGFTKAKVYLKN